MCFDFGNDLVLEADVQHGGRFSIQCLYSLGGHVRGESCVVSQWLKTLQGVAVSRSVVFRHLLAVAVGTCIEFWDDDGRRHGYGYGRSRGHGHSPTVTHCLRFHGVPPGSKMGHFHVQVWFTKRH